MSGYRVLIHACEKRMWYVEGFLVPSLEDQGIKPEIWLDDGKGNLYSCMESFQNSPKNGGTWHLQDDVVISKDFSERTKKADNGLVCGFNDGSNYRLPLSFPCIRIPNSYARECAEWFYAEGREKYKPLADLGKCDDTFFFYFWKDHKIPFEVMSPCLVDHIDFLIGGSVCDNRVTIRAADFDQSIVTELSQKISGSF